MTNLKFRDLYIYAFCAEFLFRLHSSRHFGCIVRTLCECHIFVRQQNIAFDCNYDNKYPNRVRLARPQPRSNGKECAFSVAVRFHSSSSSSSSFSFAKEFCWLNYEFWHDFCASFIRCALENSTRSISRVCHFSHEQSKRWPPSLTVLLWFASSKWKTHANTHTHSHITDLLGSLTLPEKPTAAHIVLLVPAENCSPWGHVLFIKLKKKKKNNNCFLIETRVPMRNTKHKLAAPSYSLATAAPFIQILGRWFHRKRTKLNFDCDSLFSHSQASCVAQILAASVTTKQRQSKWNYKPKKNVINKIKQTEISCCRANN